MKLRIIKVCKENLDVTLQHSTLANKRNLMKTWEKGALYPNQILTQQPMVGSMAEKIWNLVQK